MAGILLLAVGFAREGWRVLETAGVEFIGENGGGPGVRLKKSEAIDTKKTDFVALSGLNPDRQIAKEPNCLWRCTVCETNPSHDRSRTRWERP